MKDQLSVSGLPPGVGVPSWGLLASLSILMAGRTALHKETERGRGPSCDQVMETAGLCLLLVPHVLGRELGMPGGGHAELCRVELLG